MPLHCLQTRQEHDDTNDTQADSLGGNVQKVSLLGLLRAIQLISCMCWGWVREGAGVHASVPQKN